MAPIFPSVVAEALDRHSPQSPSVMTRELFAAVLTYLALTPATPKTAADRARAESALHLNPGPDWGGPKLPDFLNTYTWHLLFARSPRALDIAKACKREANLFQTTVPLIWSPLLDACVPEDLNWILTWSKAFPRNPLFGALLTAHLHNTAWDGVWAAWQAATVRAEFYLPDDLILHPALLADPTGRLDVITPLLKRATVTAQTTHTALHSHLLAVLLGRTFPNLDGTITPDKAHTFPLEHDNQRIFFTVLTDAQSAEGRAALRKAWPTALAFCAASPAERAAYVHTRVFAATTPTPVVAKAPSLNADTKTYLATSTIPYAGLPNLLSYQRRAYEALAAGKLPAPQARKVSEILESLLARKGTVLIPEHWKTQPDRALRLDRKAIDRTQAAVAPLAAVGFVDLANQAIHAYQTHLNDHGRAYIRHTDGFDALIAQPNIPGFQWLCQHAPVSNLLHNLARLVNLPGSPKDWAQTVLAATSDRQPEWVGKATMANAKGSFMCQGGVWRFANPAHRHTWLALETQKPPTAWDLSTQDLDSFSGEVFFLGHDAYQDPALSGLLRLSLALRDKDTDWIRAFTACADRVDKFVGMPLLERWKKASAHKRLHAMSALSDPAALLELPEQEVHALLRRLLA